MIKNIWTKRIFKLYCEQVITPLAKLQLKLVIVKSTTLKLYWKEYQTVVYEAFGTR